MRGLDSCTGSWCGDTRRLCSLATITKVASPSHRRGWFLHENSNAPKPPTHHSVARSSEGSFGRPRNRQLPLGPRACGAQVSSGVARNQTRFDRDDDRHRKAAQRRPAECDVKLPPLPGRASTLPATTTQSPCFQQTFWLQRRRRGGRDHRPGSRQPL